MRITTNIKNDSTNSDVAISIDKFFQFIIVGDIIDGECDVIIYNAIAFHYNETVNNSKLIVGFNINDDDDVELQHKDMSFFYKDEAIIKQFWGKNSKFSKSYKELIEELFKEKDNGFSGELNDADNINKIIDCFNDSSKTSGALYITEKKDVIKDIIIFPLSIGESTHDVVLCDIFEKLNNDLKCAASNGYWFKTKFKHKIENNHQGFKIKASISLDNAKFKSPDFKIYIQTNEKYDIKYNESSIDGKVVHIEKVYSQNSLNYFKEWIYDGINKSSLFRLNNNNEIDKEINENIVKFNSSIQFEDIFASRRREINILIFSIILSLICSIGLDVTRQDKIVFGNIFPRGFNLSLDALWLIACLSLAVKVFFYKISKVKLIVKLLLFCPAFIWFSVYFLFSFNDERYTCNDFTYGDSLLCLGYLQKKLFLSDIIIFGTILFLMVLNFFKSSWVFKLKYSKKLMNKIFGE
ncbi:hypothetical protein REJ26_002626 [Providencia stuartii]|uniref:hypothetical protein n=1 Tax=Providencia TaxID=586 RepID=UPI0027F9D08F|nr:hypothetical protein [Providencia sp. 2023EL-00965]ELR5300981.1 hypothetical protein [Providencia stuartii]MDW7587942.1 hypothetical protein [Providencia sp. 2023EL-00965]